MGSKQLENVAVQGFGTPVPVGAASAGLGSFQPSSYDYSIPIETNDNFAKKDQMARTPPRARTHLLPDIDFGENTLALKSRRGEDSQAEHPKQVRSNQMILKQTVVVMASQIKKLEKVVRETHKLKKRVL